MKEKNFTVSYEPSAVGTRTIVYAVNPNASHATVLGIQVANATTSGFDVDAAWVEDSKKVVNYADSTTLGDGTITKAKFFYASALHVIVEDVHIPAGAALGVIANPLFLQARDAVGIRPSTTGSDSAFKPIVTVTEFYDDDADMSTSVDLDDVNNQFLLFEY